MSQPKPSDHGIVVDHKEVALRYAILDDMFDPKVHDYVRDLKPGETVIGYQAKPKPETTTEAKAPAPDPTPDSAPAVKK